MNKGLRGKFAKIFRTKQKSGTVIVPRKSHCISRDDISPNAVKVLYRLKKSGHAAFLVGGGVRDLLLGRRPKDFDVVTNVPPDTVRKTFNNSRLIGRRFRLVHVFFPGENIEVSTFRANLGEAHASKMETENTYGTIEEDAWRRDFTVNALFYNIVDFSVLDYTGGMQDLKNHLIRMIGDPVQRYHEDPVRLLRAIRLAAKLRFKIHPDTEAPLEPLSHLLQHVPSSRLYEELLKLFFNGYAMLTYDRLNQYHYLTVLFPQTVEALQTRKNDKDKKTNNTSYAGNRRSFR